MKSLFKIFIFIIFISSFVSCKPEVKNNLTESGLKSDDIIVFTDEQKAISGIETGKLEKKLFSSEILCNGNIEPTPKSLAQVSSPYGGIIKSINHYIGEKVKKGDVLVILENPEFIKIQEEYLINEGNYEYIKKEYSRKKELFNEKAVSEKDFLKAKAEFTSLDAKLLSLKSRLELINIEPANIKKDGLKAEVALKSPISGYISKIPENLGKYVGQQEILLEIIDPSNLHLHLRIFEKDISHIKVNQKAYFSTLSEPEKTYIANIFSLGRSVNSEDHSITVHADIQNKDQNLIPGLFISARIQSSAKEFFSIPSEGIIRAEDINYIFIEENDGFTRIPVKIGEENNNYIAILNPGQNILNSTVVIKGAYFINAALEGSQEE